MTPKIKKIVEAITKAIADKFTGQIQLEINMNQGGIGQVFVNTKSKLED
ncbi:MAG: hypothetical protein KQH63_18505 [Desulfobulbaceae bacterium]|nr:hypothetical protein [Desulfobulbaceae bacterium]